MTIVRILKAEEIGRKSRELKCLANEHRLGIVMYLKEKKTASVGELADNLKASFKATSKHLAILIKGGVVICRSDNPFMIYSLSPNSPSIILSVISSL